MEYTLCRSEQSEESIAEILHEVYPEAERREVHLSFRIGAQGSA